MNEKLETTLAAEAVEPERGVVKETNDERGVRAFRTTRAAMHAWQRTQQRKKELEVMLRQSVIDEAKALEEYKSSKEAMAKALEEET